MGSDTPRRAVAGAPRVAAGVLAAIQLGVVVVVVALRAGSGAEVGVGIAYLVVHTTRADRRRSPVAAALIVPALLVAAFATLVVHPDPLCYARDSSGDVTVERPVEGVMQDSQTIEPESDVVERGCTSDTVVWWEAAGSLALSGAAFAAALVLVPRAPRDAGGSGAAGS